MNPLRRADVHVAKLLDAGPTAQVQWAQTPGGPATNAVNALAKSGTRHLQRPHRRGEVSFLASFTDVASLATTPAAGPLASSHLYPNPAHATATVQLPAGHGASVATLTLCDALGRAVRTTTVVLPAASKHHELNLAGLPAGLCAPQVQAGEARAIHRLVVE